MKQLGAAALIIFASLLGIVILNSAYIVDETEQVVITQFGQPVKKPVQKPGLHWRTPFIQEVHRFDKRVLNWDGYPSQVPTHDKKFIWVDTTGRWRITDPLLFLQTMRNERNAQSRLDDIMDGITRNNLTRYSLVEIVRSSNQLLDAKDESEDGFSQSDFDRVNTGREEITRKILEEAKAVVKEYGIELIDLRIKRINYIESVQKKVYDRMISERNRAAEQLRSEGLGVRAEVEGQKEKELSRITSEAYEQAQKIKGQADADATKIYGDAYSKDPDFYAFVRSLEAYPKTLKDGRLFLTTDSDFLKYLKQTDAKA